MARVALVYNLVHPEQLRRGPLDTVAEYDNEETIDFTEDTTRDLLSNLDRINLSGFERTEE